MNDPIMTTEERNDIRSTLTLLRDNTTPMFKDSGIEQGRLRLTKGVTLVLHNYVRIEGVRLTALLTTGSDDPDNEYLCVNHWSINSEGAWDKFVRDVEWMLE